MTDAEGSASAAARELSKLGASRAVMPVPTCLAPRSGPRSPAARFVPGGPKRASGPHLRLRSRLMNFLIPCSAADSTSATWSLRATYSTTFAES